MLRIVSPQKALTQNVNYDIILTLFVMQALLQFCFLMKGFYIMKRLFENRQYTLKKSIYTLIPGETVIIIKEKYLGHVCGYKKCQYVVDVKALATDKIITIPTKYIK